MNAKMHELKRCFEAVGFTEVRTVLSSGNVVFNARAATLHALERRAEKAMQDELGRTFMTIVRPAQALKALVQAQPFAEFELPPTAKCVVTFLRRPHEARLSLPVERDGAAILKVAATEVYSAYVPGDTGPAFMSLLERTFGKDITTRTLDTVRKCSLA